jgi:hypothetical protein
VETDMKVINEMEAVIKTHQYGTPFLEHLRRNLGACLFCAIPNR